MIAFFRRLWFFVRPYQGRLLLGLLCGLMFALASGGVMVAVKLVVDVIFGASSTTTVADQLRKAPLFVQRLVEPLLPLLPDLSQPASRPAILAAIAIVPLLMLVRGVFAYLNIYLLNWAAVRAVADLRTRLFDHLQNLSLSFFSKASTGDVICRITNDTQVLSMIVGTTTTFLLKDPFTIVTLLVLLLSQQPRLTLVSLMVVPLILVPIIVYGRKVRHSARAMQTHAAELSTLMHESFTGNRVIKAYNLEDTVLGQFKETTRQYIRHVLRVVRAHEIPSHLTEVAGAAGISLVFVYVAVAAQERMSAGDFTQFVLSIFLMYPPIKGLSRLNNHFEQARAASQRVFELLDTPSTILDPPQPQPLRAAGAAIEFRDVDFDYGDRPVLRGIQLTVPPGQVVALVGASGSGKTTLTNLLLRFYDPQRGQVCIGGTDLRTVAVKDLRRQTAIVTQETILFNDTIRHNIALGRPGATAAEIEEAARLAHAHEFIQERPQGYDAVIGEKGAMLSGGQRQRIAIARAVLKNAPILILDEATSALDTESERAVQEALEELMRGRTTICIAHRLSTIQRADLIVVLDQGRIVETGRHAELIQRGGVYRKLYELQFQGGE